VAFIKTSFHEVGLAYSGVEALGNHASYSQHIS